MVAWIGVIALLSTLPGFLHGVCLFLWGWLKKGKEFGELEHHEERGRCYIVVFVLYYGCIINSDNGNGRGGGLMDRDWGEDEGMGWVGSDRLVVLCC